MKVAKFYDLDGRKHTFVVDDMGAKLLENLDIENAIYGLTIVEKEQENGN